MRVPEFFAWVGLTGSTVSNNTMYRASAHGLVRLGGIAIREGSVALHRSRGHGSRQLEGGVWEDDLKGCLWCGQQVWDELNGRLAPRLLLCLGSLVNLTGEMLKTV